MKLPRLLCVIFFVMLGGIGFLIATQVWFSWNSLNVTMYYHHFEAIEKDMLLIPLAMVGGNSPTKNESFSTPAPFPPTCTDDQRAIINYQLPPDHCLEFAKRPWTNKCSFSYASCCHEAVWLDEYYSTAPPQSSFVAIYVGCNKGMDAINSLRMGSKDARVDKFKWRDEFLALNRNSPGVQDGGGQQGQVAAGVCGQEHSAQFPLPPENSQQPATVHCLEAMPGTAAHLQQTAQKFPWKDQFIVMNAALSSQDGLTSFPEADTVGFEKGSICKSFHTPGCKPVPLLRLDSYLERHQNTTSSDDFIDFLSIDVEGNDAEVLTGANMTLLRVRYLEFEYNWRPPWNRHSLQTVVQRQLKDQGFVCYWPGMQGHIWRVTDCWLDHYERHFWSNMACVNLELHPELALRMEEMFLATLASNRTIQYTERPKVYM